MVNDLLKLLNGDGNGCDPVINVVRLVLLPLLPNEGEWLINELLLVNAVLEVLGEIIESLMDIFLAVVVVVVVVVLAWFENELLGVALIGVDVLEAVLDNFLW